WRATQARKHPKARLEQPRRVLLNQRISPLVVEVECSHHVGSNILLVPYLKAGCRELAAPVLDRGARTEIGIQQVAAWPQYPRYLAEEACRRGIAMRRFDIEHGVEDRCVKRQVLGMARHKTNAGGTMAHCTEPDRAIGIIEASDHPRFEVPGEECRATAPPTPHLQHLVAADVD